MPRYNKEYHIDKFRGALLNVAPEYFTFPAMGNRMQIVERAFAYELYHQLRLRYNGSNWYINGELRKGLTFFPEYQMENTFIPDLVIHEHGTNSGNAVAVEIKTDVSVTGTSIVEDLHKLEIYTRPGNQYLDYKIGIMLIVNSDFRTKFQNMSSENKSEILRLLNYGRTAIWNIAAPVVLNRTDTEAHLRDDCLSVFYFHTVQALLQPAV